MLCASALGLTLKIDVAMNASSDADRNAHVRRCFFLAPNDKRSSPVLWEFLIFLSFEDVIHNKITLHTYETRFCFVIILILLINSFDLAMPRENLPINTEVCHYGKITPIRIQTFFCYWPIFYNLF